MENIENTICEFLENKKVIVLATIIDHMGSTPRKKGSKMIIFSDGKTFGTIGGGLLEADVIKDALKLFKTKSSIIKPVNMTSDMVDSSGMICGGKLTVLIEFIESTNNNLKIFKKITELKNNKKKILVILTLPKPNEANFLPKRNILENHNLNYDDLKISDENLEIIKSKLKKNNFAFIYSSEDRSYFVEQNIIAKTVYLFGAGHVSQQVAMLADMVDFKTCIIDDRRQFANNGLFKTANQVMVIDSFEHVFDELSIDNNCYIVIVTRGHKHDKTVLAQALNTKAGYIGMIGSKKKRNAIYKALINQGITSKDLKQVHCPIGISIDAQTPQEIAISILAELIATRANS